MSEYVYALHDFLPENEDEVSFHAGERIEVVERDDLYGDGWWQGRNLAGKVGLFPVSYTQPAPPTSQSVPDGLGGVGGATGQISDDDAANAHTNVNNVNTNTNYDQHQQEQDDHQHPQDDHPEEYHPDEYRRPSYDSGYRVQSGLEAIHEHDEPASSTNPSTTASPQLSQGQVQAQTQAQSYMQIHTQPQIQPQSQAQAAGSSSGSGQHLQTPSEPHLQRLDSNHSAQSDRSLYPDSLSSRLHPNSDPYSNHNGINSIIGTNGEPSPRSEDGRRMMRATLTDVQQAIEQLGARGALDDGARSFSFASSRSGVSASDASGSETDADDDDYDTEYGNDDDEDGDGDGQGWHKDARTKLAEKARRAAEREQRHREREHARSTLGPRTIAPPIEVELSDESEPEEDDTRHPAGPPGSGYGHGSSSISGAASGFIPRTHGAIQEESEDGSVRAHSPTLLRRIESPEPTATATRATFDIPPIVQSTHASNATHSPYEPTIYPPPNDPMARRISQIYPDKDELAPEEEGPQGLPTPVSPSVALPTEHTAPSQAQALSAPSAPAPAPAPANIPVASSSGTVMPVPIPMVISPTPHASEQQLAHAPDTRDMNTNMNAMHALPSPAASSGSHHFRQPQATFPSMAPMTPPQYPSALRHIQNETDTPQSATSALSGQSALSGMSTHPSEWTVDEVVAWLQSKGFDQGVCDAFVENEVTGDVLLEIDAQVLKSEFGIAAFGKRVRIANAISELKRPASFSYSDHKAFGGGQGGQGGYGGGGQGGYGAHGSHGAPSPIAEPGPGMGMAGALQTPASHGSSAVASLRSVSPHPAGGAADMGQNAQANGNGSMSAPGSTSYHHRRNISDVSGSVASSVRWTTSVGNETGYTTADGTISEQSHAPYQGQGQGQNQNQNQGGGVGLGLAQVPRSLMPGRAPAQLMLSPSEGALSARAHSERAEQIPEEEEERAVLSESEVAPKEKSKRRQFFGRSLESTFDKDKDNKDKDNDKDSGDGKGKDSMEIAPSPLSAKSAKSDGVTAGAATETGSLRSRHSKKRSMDGNAVGDKKERLSIFGGISGSIGKTRKPAPRYSAVIDNADIPSQEKQHSHRLLSSLYPNSSAKRTSGPKPRGASLNESPTTTSPVDARTAYAESAPPQDKQPALLRKRTGAADEVPQNVPLPPSTIKPGTGERRNSNGGALKQGQSILEQIGTPDHEGWMRKKGERYNSWKVRYFALKGPHLYCLRSNSKTETKIKGYINIAGYKVIADESIDPGRYGFRLVHETDQVHFFSSEEKSIIREWMKALIKATITRDYQKPVISSVNIPTIPLAVAQTMNPAPRPPSPEARDATQRASRRENPNQLSTRDAQILMGIPGQDKNGKPIPPAQQNRQLPTAFREETPGQGKGQGIPASSSMPTPLSPRVVQAMAPPRPSREMRRASSTMSQTGGIEPGLIEWANSKLPQHLHIVDSAGGSLCGGLTLLRLAEAIKGKPASPPVLDSAFPSGPADDKLDGLFRLFDFLLDNDVKLGTVSINDVKQARRDKIVQIIRALKQWEDKRRGIAVTLAQVPSLQGGLAGPMMPGGSAW